MHCSSRAVKLKLFTITGRQDHQLSLTPIEPGLETSEEILCFQFHSFLFPAMRKRDQRRQLPGAKAVERKKKKSIISWG